VPAELARRERIGRSFIVIERAHMLDEAQLRGAVGHLLIRYRLDLDDVGVGDARWILGAHPQGLQVAEDLIASVQNQAHLSYTETIFTQPDMVEADDTHRLSQPWEVKTFELTVIDVADYVALGARRHRIACEAALTRIGDREGLLRPAEPVDRARRLLDAFARWLSRRCRKLQATRWRGCAGLQPRGTA
jgi:hypothetical protein